MVLLALSLLSAAPLTPLPNSQEDVPVVFARLDAAWVPVSSVCEAQGVLVTLTPEAFTRLDPKTGKPGERLALKPMEGAEPEWEGAAGTSYRMYSRTSADGRELQVHESLSNYWADWAPNTTVAESVRTVPPGGQRWRVRCPGGRVLMQCFTSRRLARVLVAGDQNDEPAHYTVDYAALPLGGGQKETLHLSGGKVTRSGMSIRAEFRNKGFRYLLEASVDPQKPGATLQVFKGKQGIQTEECVGYAAYPKHAEWAQALH